MAQTEQPEKKSDYPDPLPSNAENTDGPSAPKQEKIARHNIENAKQFWRRWMERPIACIVRWIDKHDGVVTAAATVAIAFLTWSLSQDSRRQADTANNQFRIMKGQLDAMEADQRPWVSIDGDHHSGIVWDERGARLSVLFNLKNVGKSPAADVFFEAKAILPKIGGPAIPLNAMMEYAADINRRRATSEMAGEFYFPNHTYPTGMGLLIDRNDFKALTRDTNMPDVLPRIIACVSYRIVTRVDFKQTCTSYYVTTTRNDHPGESFGVGLDVNIPADRVLIGTAFYSYAD
jgi:hypothetical protein